MTDTTRRAAISSGDAAFTEPARPAFRVGADDLPQYTRGRVPWIWAAAALPMAVLAWVGAPLLAGAFDGPSAWPRAIVLSLTAGPGVAVRPCAAARPPRARFAALAGGQTSPLRRH